MRKKAFRLGRERITELMRKGKKLSNNYLSLFYLADNSSLGRSTIIVPAKTEKSSARRHLLKRRVAYLVRTQGLPQIDVVIMVSKAAATLPFVGLKQAYNDILKRI